MVLKLENVCKSFGETEALRSISLEVKRGEFIALVGPSGCGKTTLLNIMSGFESPTSGTLDRNEPGHMIYQSDGLFPWRTAAQNIELGLQYTPDKLHREKELQNILDLIGLDGFGDHYPHELSGGMRQRVELARALVGGNNVLLMDEPFSALDYITRLHMRREFTRLLEKRPRTVILVTHDIEEAAQLADRVIVLSDRPAQVRSERTIRLPRPRELTHPEVVKAVHDVLREMGLEK
ncbi:MAG TPA: ABC transporter ATP-binding protein [Bacteroidota bacterium]|jgi:ABC-type nitrate/sulfonate/bicarbonate transport system ATPase subunit|nr:ABC transporter ATP-binding protein [Bacteroidota bacterium]